MTLPNLHQPEMKFRLTHSVLWIDPVLFRGQTNFLNWQKLTLTNMFSNSLLDMEKVVIPKTGEKLYFMVKIPILECYMICKAYQYLMLAKKMNPNRIWDRPNCLRQHTAALRPGICVKYFLSFPQKKPGTRENWDKLSVYFSIFEWYWVFFHERLFSRQCSASLSKSWEKR